MSGIPLSVLDLSPVSTGSTSAAALRASVALARRTEALGYQRYWVAEHHGMPGIASSSPAVLISALAAATTTLRVGSGGVMLPNHAPLVVAEQFGTLVGLYGDRVDLGIGRAPGTDPATAAALRRSTGALSDDDSTQQLLQLRAFFAGSWPAGHAYAGLRAVPAEGNVPDVWLLGSSGYSAQLAGVLGLPFAFAHHFSGHNTLPALELYRSRFQPSERLAEPYAMVCAAVLCAADDERAQELAWPGALSFLRLRQGAPSTTPSPEETAAHPWTPAERAFAEERLASMVIGSPETVRRGLGELAAATAADELMVMTSTFDPADRERSYELLAGLGERTPGGLVLPSTVAA